MNHKPTIGLKSLVFALIGSTIGSGWLFAGLYAAQIAGPAAILAWVLAGTLIFLFSLAYMELGIAFPVSGGAVKYSQFSHGSLVGYLAGFLSWLFYVMVAPLEVLAVIQYATDYLPFLTKTRGSAADLTTSGLLVAGTLLLAVTALNLFSLRWVIRVHNGTVDWKLIVPALTVILLFGLDFHPENFTAHGGLFPAGIPSMLTAIMAGGILYSTFGFRVVVDLAGELENPQRDIPRAIAIGLGAVVVFYVLLQLAFIGALRPEDLKDGWARLAFADMTGPYAALLAGAGLGWMAFVLYLDAIVSPLGTGIIFTTSTARITMAMAESRYFPAALAPLDTQGVPARAIWLNFAMGLILLAPLPDWQTIVSFGASAIVLSFAFAQITLAAMRRRGLALNPGFRVRRIQWLAWFNCVIINCLLFAAGWQSNQVLLIAIGLGFLYYTGYRFSRREPLSRGELRSLPWVTCYLAWVFSSSWMGPFGSGTGWLTPVAGFSLQVLVTTGIYLWAVHSALTRAEMESEIRAAGLQPTAAVAPR